MKTIGIFISDVEKARNFEWISRALDKKKFRQVYFLINDRKTELEEHLQEGGHHVYRLQGNSKLAVARNIWKARGLLKREKVDVVHCHLRIANIIGLLSAKLAGVRGRIYTRHFSTYHHEYHPKAVRLDLFLNNMSSKIIAISKNVNQVLLEKEKVAKEKVALIPHGFIPADFRDVESSRVNKLREKYGFGKDTYIVGVIARFDEWKGIQYIIPAFREFLKICPRAHLVLANAHGPYEDKIRSMLRDIPDSSYTLIAFEPDSPALYNLMDVYVHTPIDDHSEAFGQTYVEALLAGIPSIFSLSGIANEFVQNDVNAMTVPFRNSEAITKALEKVKNGDYSTEIIEKGRKDAMEKFSFDLMMKRLEELYQNPY